MAITSIQVMNIMAFQQEQVFKLDFSDGINIIIGENGTGKTTLLKMIYAAAQYTEGNTNDFHELFSNFITDKELLVSNEGLPHHCHFYVSDSKGTFGYNFYNEIFPKCSKHCDFDFHIKSVFIPTTEMLSHSKGFLALNEKFKMPFDKTQVDIIVNASLPEARKVPEYMRKILDEISKAIDGEVIQENDVFYVLKSDGRKIDFSLEAEGLRKLALLWKLIRNGLLEEGTALLWDEPEANLNPELFPLVVKILLELQKNGIQIFVATHSYNFAKYLEILRTNKEQVQFHNLYRSESKEICGQSAYKMEDLEPNHIMNADKELLDMVYSEMVNGND